MLLRPDSGLAVALAAAVLTGLLVAYGLAVTAGVPVLHPETEPIESLAVATKLVELAGLLAAVSVLHHVGRFVPALVRRPKGTLA